MGKKLAILFPGVRYSCDKPLLYYSKKVLAQNGYDVIGLNYNSLEAEPLFLAFQADANKNDGADKRITKENLLSFVKKAKEAVQNQLKGIEVSEYEKIIFVEKSIGAVIGGIYAKQVGINPYHIMLTPIDYAFQFTEGAKGSVFVGSNDDLCNYETIKKISGDRNWNFSGFTGGNHSLETGEIATDLEHLKRYISELDNISKDLDKSIYDFCVLGRKQQEIPLSQYKGKILLIVNTATGCGFTPQYHLLESLYKKYHGQGLEILDFPCNQFANQAPGTEEEIFSFCTAQYDITFEQFAKIHVNGEKQSELYAYLKSRKGFEGFDMSKPDSNYLIRRLEKEAPGYETSSDIKWNFTKFLVDRNGLVIDRFEPTTDMELVDKAIEQLL